MSGEPSKTQDGSWLVTLLADKWIQRWRIHATGVETFLFEDNEIFTKVFNLFHKKLWINRGNSLTFISNKSFVILSYPVIDSTGIEVKFIDMQTMDSKIVILASAFNFSHTPQVFYALITVTEENQSFTISSYCQLKHNTFYTGNPAKDVIRMKFTMTRNAAYIYEEKTIFQVYLNGNVDYSITIQLQHIKQNIL